ncbi:MAG: GNAT family N-acetyltransferase [Gammaproteobacteria bacterium]|nr:GNAT family N-acetyltransferase [Gammaproteobacteria bacterium]
MNVTISRVGTPSPEEWDQAWAECPYATYFHSREWLEIWSQNYLRCSPAPIFCELSTGVRVVFPLIKEIFFKGLASKYISSPAGTFGGWLAVRHLTSLEQACVFDYVFRKYPNLHWRLNPYEPLAENIALSVVTKDETHSLDVSVGFDEIYRRWSQGNASAARKVRKARKSGVTIRLAETANDWAAYYQTYIDSYTRWGDKASGFYDWQFFETLFKKQSSNTKLWLALYQGDVIAGALCFYSQTNVVYWHGAALSSYFPLRPVNLLMYEAIRDAAENGYEWFDFNPSGGHEGVKHFKKSFGAEALSSNVIRRVSLPIKAFQAFGSIIKCIF